MAPRLNWSTELRKIILEDALSCYCRHARDEEENGLQKLSKEDFLPLPDSIKDSDDEIAKEIHEDLKNQILHLFREAFMKFEETKSKFFKMRVSEHFSGGLNSIDTLFNKLVLNNISENDFKEEYKCRIKRLRRPIIEDYDELFKSYYDGCYFLFNQFKSPSLNLAGYLSIYYAFKSILSNLWEEHKHKYFIRFNKHSEKIRGKPIQLWFCNFILKGIDFFSSDYSYFDIFEHFKSSLELDRDSYFFKISDYITKGGGEKLLKEIVSHIVNRICGKEAFFRGRGDLLSSFFMQFINMLKRLYSNTLEESMDISINELEKLYNFLMLQNGVLEYEVFRIAANSGYACLPKISIIIDEEGRREEKEIDLLIVEDDRLSLVETTFRRDVEKCQEKLNIIIDRLEESVSGLDFEKYIITNDNFKDFVNSLSDGLNLSIL